MNEKEYGLNYLPKVMAERAIWARKEFIKNPKNGKLLYNPKWE